MNKIPIVNFLIIGIQKGGTESAKEYLAKHPNIYMHPNEIHYFDSNYNHGRKWYNRHFLRNKRIGEKTPRYMMSRIYLKRISVYNPDMKLVILLREPIQRMFSQWNFSLNRGDHKFMKFGNYVNHQLGQFKKGKSIHNSIYKGCYSVHLKNTYEYFKKDNVCVEISEQVLKRPIHHYNRIYEFLGVRKYNINFEKKYHKTVYVDTLQKEEIQKLYKIFEPYNKELYEILGHSIPEWENFYKKWKCKLN